MCRPLKFDSVEKLEAMIEEYFGECETEKRPLTLSGLAYALDCDRKTLLNYKKRAKFFPAIARAKARCEAFSEESLYTKKNANGVKLSLENNFGWKESKEIDVTSGGEKLQERVFVVPGFAGDDGNGDDSEAEG